MTRSVKAAPATVSFAVTPVGFEVPATQSDKPSTIELVGPIHSVLAQASALCRLGFTISMEHMPTMYATTGTAIVVLVTGDPDPAMIEAATQAMNDALARERHMALDAEKRAVVAEREREEQASRDATKSAIEAQIAAQQESIRQLQASLATA